MDFWDGQKRVWREKFLVAGFRRLRREWSVAGSLRLGLGMDRREVSHGLILGGNEENLTERPFSHAIHEKWSFVGMFWVFIGLLFQRRAQADDSGEVEHCLGLRGLGYQSAAVLAEGAEQG